MRKARREFKKQIVLNKQSEQTLILRVSVQANVEHHYEAPSTVCPGEDWFELDRITSLNVEVEISPDDCDVIDGDMVPIGQWFEGIHFSDQDHIKPAIVFLKNGFNLDVEDGWNTGDYEQEEQTND